MQQEQSPLDYGWIAVLILFSVAAVLLIFIIYRQKGRIFDFLKSLPIRIVNFKNYLFKGIRQTVQRFRATMPTYFRNIFIAGTTFILAPDFLELISNVSAVMGLFPKWIKPDWITQWQMFAGGCITVAKLAVSYRRTKPEQIPDLNHPVQALIKVDEAGQTEIEVLKPID